MAAALQPLLTSRPLLPRSLLCLLRNRMAAALHTNLTCTPWSSVYPSSACPPRPLLPALATVLACAIVWLLPSTPSSPTLLGAAVYPRAACLHGRCCPRWLPVLACAIVWLLPSTPSSPTLLAVIMVHIWMWIKITCH
jgi:hypothetical protein